MKRYGTVLVFKKGITAKQAADALAKIKDVIDLDGYVRKGIEDRVQEYDDRYGGPVWYIP
jgi:hypothetical protein